MPAFLSTVVRRLSFLLLVALAGCGSLSVAENQPLPTERKNEPGASSISNGGYTLTNLTSEQDPDDLLVVVAMSGGGKRSAAFSFGALKGLDALKLDTSWGERSVADEMDLITSVSGGSFTAAYWGLHHRDAFKTYPENFLYRNVEGFIWGIYFLPWRWGWLVNPTVGTNDYMDRVYDRLLFHGATYADLTKKGRPLIALGASDVSFGTPFIFTQLYFDLICSDLSTFPVSRAVAASNGFPGIFSPITLENHAERCEGRKPAWYTALTQEQRSDPFALIHPQVQAVERYTDVNKVRFVHLMDGGITDNLALRSTMEQMVLLTGSPTRIINLGLTKYRRILVISLDGQSAQNSSVAQQRVVGGIFTLFSLVSGAQIDRYNLETLRMMRNESPGFAKALSDARCSLGKEVNGYACDDVKVQFVHLALSSLPPGPLAERLRSIPTGLTIPRADVDALVEVGENMVLESQELKEFLADYHPTVVRP